MNKSALPNILEQQVRQLEEEREQLFVVKAQLLFEVEENRQIADKLAIQIKDHDKVKQDEQ